MRIGSRLHKLTALAGVGAAAVGVIYLTLFGSDAPSTLLNRDISADRIDLYVDQPSGRKFDEQGHLIQTFTATRLEHFLKSNQSEMTAPQFQIFTRRGDIWNGTAARATVIGDSEIRLRDNVAIVDAAATTRLTTEQLNYFPQLQRVDSAVRVHIRRATDTTQSVGVRADLNTNRVELLSRVEGVHVAP